MSSLVDGQVARPLAGCVCSGDKRLVYRFREPRALTQACQDVIRIHQQVFHTIHPELSA